MKDVKTITQRGGFHQSLTLFILELQEAIKDGYTIEGNMTLSNQHFAVHSATLVKELTPEEATEKVIDEVPSLGSVTEESPEDELPADVALEEFAEAVDDLLGDPEVDNEPPSQGFSVEDIVTLKGYTKKTDMTRFMKQHGIELKEIPKQPAALKKAILAVIDPD